MLRQQEVRERREEQVPAGILIFPEEGVRQDMEADRAETAEGDMETVPEARVILGVFVMEPLAETTEEEVAAEAGRVVTGRSITYFFLTQIDTDSL